MTRKLVECIPNFSEGRDRAKVDAIAAAMCQAFLEAGVQCKALVVPVDAEGAKVL